MERRLPNRDRKGAVKRMPMTKRNTTSLYMLAWSSSLLACACVPATPDGNGNTHVCEQPGTICTVAGTGESSFNGDGKDALETSLYYPLDVEFDETARPLILDFNNLRLRRINGDNTIETILGVDYEDVPIEGAPAIETPLHHASDVEPDSLGRLFVAGYHAPVVFRVDTDKRVYGVAGSGDFGNTGDGGPALDATFLAPFGVVPDAQGGLYISDLDAHVVRYIASDGIITTVAGHGTPGYSGDGGPGDAAQLTRPTHLRLDPNGNLLICDTGNHAIRRLNADGTIETIAGTGLAGSSGDGGLASAAQLDSPHDLRFAPDGTLHIADRGNNAIRRIDEHGIITTVVGTGGRGFAGDAGNANACLLDRPSGINFAPDGSLWIADTYNQRVRRVANYATAPSE